MKKIDNSKLDVRQAKKHGGTIILPLTGYLEDNKKYVVEKRLEKRKLNGEDRIVTEIVIQSVDDAKLICQNWNKTSCEDCNVHKEDGCELNVE